MCQGFEGSNLLVERVYLQQAQEQVCLRGWMGNPLVMRESQDLRELKLELELELAPESRQAELVDLSKGFDWMEDHCPQRVPAAQQALAQGCPDQRQVERQVLAQDCLEE